MKRTLFLLIALLLFPAAMVQGQTAVTLQSLDVELWPDYDREAVLVLLTGTLAASQPLPVTLTIPLPEGADFNVVARITPDNVMTDQGITPTVNDDSVTFTLTESRFRVEFYEPYAANETQRSFSYNWQSDLISVDQLNATIQQPFDATQLNTIPPASNVGQGQDGLTYHEIPAQAVPAGEPYTLNVDYTMSTGALTVTFLVNDAVPTDTELPFLDAVPVEDEGFDLQLLLIVLGGLILVATAVWFLLNNRQAKRPAKPKPRRTAKQPGKQTAVAPTNASKANFCHQCGEALQASDKFCRSCGTAVKGK